MTIPQIDYAMQSAAISSIQNRLNEIADRDQMFWSLRDICSLRDTVQIQINFAYGINLITRLQRDDLYKELRFALLPVAIRPFHVVTENNEKEHA
jgi:hypothetical protein